MNAPATDVAALYVDRNGPYPARVEQWFDDRRDARTYTGELPIIAHPPCQRWCRLAGLVEARWGHKKGDDGGLFAHALSEVRRVGGVLEHPAYSDAWPAFGLPRPVTGGEWTCYVEQWRYGHRARKATWLYYRGFRKPFDLKWGYLDPKTTDGPLQQWRGQTRAQRALARHNIGRADGSHAQPTGSVSRLALRRDATGKLHGSALPKLTKKQSIATPPEFLEVLLALARWAA